jgi:predicted alpha/beta hydrolase family esterase
METANRGRQGAVSERFVVVHGLDGSGLGHWQVWLVRRLRGGGHEVAFPELPDPSDPDPDEWQAVIEAELGVGSQPVVICHSLACLVWLRIAASSDRRRAERVLLVAPPWREDVEPVLRALSHEATADDVEHAAGSTLLVCSDDDPYCPPGAVAAFAAPLEIESVVIGGAGHLNPEAGYGPWPDCEAWALTARWP